jgi:Cu+-exporting ATPase
MDGILEIGHGFIKYDPNICSFSQVLRSLKLLGEVREAKKEIITTTGHASDNLFRRVVAASIFAMPLFILAMLPMVVDIDIPFAGILQVILVIHIIVIAYEIIKTGMLSLLRLTPNMNSLIMIGSGLAFFYSVYNLLTTGHTHNLYFETTGVILTLVLWGKFFELRCKSRAYQSISKLLNLLPPLIVVSRNGQELELEPEEILIGDRIRIRAGDYIPVDGIVSDGAGIVDESMITGESLGINKTVGDKVISGTINLSGSFSFEAKQVGEDTTLSKLIALVKNAQSSKGPLTRIVDVVSGYFVWGIFSLALLVAIFWWCLGFPVEYILARAISVLIIACPCALGLSTPMAIMIAVAKGAASGILIKEGSCLELATKVGTIFLDKTGTVTSQNIRVVQEKADDTLYFYAASLEKGSSHPMANALINYATRKNIKLIGPSSFEIKSKGISGTVEGKLVEIENDSVAEGILLNVSVDGAKLGVIKLENSVKDSSIEAIAALRELGKRVILLTGDQVGPANYVADEVGVDELFYGKTPSEKLEIVKKFQEDGPVMMVGDGVNDAASLMAADVGAAINRGSDIAMDAADLILVKNNLMDLVKFIKLSAFTLRVIKQNLFWAFFYNAIGVLLASGLLQLYFTLPLLSPMVAAAAMMFSSISVIFNSLRIEID